MLKRAWMILATLWAILLSWLIFRDSGPVAAGPLVIAYGPLFAPLLLRWLATYVLTGANPFRRRPPVTVYRTRR